MIAAHPVTPKQYYLQDSRGNVGDNLMFWSAAGGYTSDIAAAEKFSEEKAFLQNASRPTDVPWPTDYLAAHVRPVVDMQTVNTEEALSYSESELFYLQHPDRGHYIGNDILFLAAGRAKKYTTNLTQARVFSRAEVQAAALRQTPGVFWPKAYIDEKSRVAADYHGVDVKKALAETASTLAKSDKVCAHRYRCHGCGVFLSVASYYGDCPKCDTDNRP
jgi:hypothetical protein